MNRTHVVFLSVLAVLVLGSGARAEDTIPTLETKVKPVEGKLALEISGTAPDSVNWLGVSFYLPNYADPVWDGDHAVYLLPKGKFTKTYAIPAGFEKGTYEAALWKSLLEKKEVYRLKTLRGYGSGTVTND